MLGLAAGLAGGLIARGVSKAVIGNSLKPVVGDSVKRRVKKKMSTGELKPKRKKAQEEEQEEPKKKFSVGDAQKVGSVIKSVIGK